jgi:uncharacterized protein (TIGR00288 family)
MNEIYSRAPHRPAASVDAHTPHAALLIDFDNVTMGIRSNLGQELRKLLDSDMIRGKVSVQRAYADWRRYPQYIASLSEASIDLIFAPAYGSTKKNATDIRLAIDALEIVFIRPEIGTFILLSGDSDFSSLVLKLKEYGKYVIGVGIQESSSDLLVQNCDEYYSYNSLSGLTSASDMQNIEKHDPWELAAKAIRRMTERGDVMRSDRFKQVMLELDPSFSEKSIGFSKFNRFLTESASRGILDLHKAANGQYEVGIGKRVDEYAGGGGAPSAPAPSGTRSQAPRKDSGEERGRGRSRGRDEGAKSEKAEPRPEPRSGRRGRSREPRREEPPRETPPSVDEDRLRAAYELLRSVVAEKAARSGSVRDSEVKRQMVEKDPNFDEAALGFRKFSRFLRQAHDEEVINLERTGEGNYKISAVASDGVVESKPQTEEPASQESGEERGRGRSRGRRDRRERSGSGRGRAEKTETKETSESPEPVDDEPAIEAEAAPPVAETPAAKTPEPDETVSEPASEVPARKPVADSAKPGQAPTRLTGRSRRPPKPKAGPSVVPGPVHSADTPARDAAPEAEKHVAEEKKEAAPARPASRSMGRFRRGSRGPGGPAAGAASRTTSDKRPETGGDEVQQRQDAPSSAGLTSDQADVVEKMARGYQGVGRRTAERLVEEFGDQVLEVIDNQPGRIEEVLPRGRAQAVIDGRRSELEESED